MLGRNMKAVGLHNYLPVENNKCFEDVMLDRPSASGHDILVKVRAVSVNPVDTKVRSPKSNSEAIARVLGWDVAGEVVEVGEDVTLFSVGDEVFYAGCITRPGGNSEYHLVDERIVGNKPATLSFEEAAALPLTAITAWESLFDKMRLDVFPSAANAGKKLLIIGGAGGVGSIAIQLAKKVAGVGTVIATASRDESREWCLEMGADICVDYKSGLKKALQDAGVGQVDLIFCLNSTEQYFRVMSEIIKPNGIITTIVETKGGVPLDMNLLQAKSVIFAWELMYTKSIFQTPDMIAQHNLLNAVAKYIDSGVLRSTMRRNIGELNARNLIQAHREIESGTTVGKIVLSGIQATQSNHGE